MRLPALGKHLDFESRRRDLGSDMGSKTQLLRSHVQARRSVESIPIQNSECRHAQACRLLRHRLRHGGSFEEREGRTTVKFNVALSHTDLPRTRYLTEVHAEGEVPVEAARRLHPIHRLPTAVHPTSSRSTAKGHSPSRIPAVRLSRTGSTEQHRDRPPWLVAQAESTVAPGGEQLAELVSFLPHLAGTVPSQIRRHRSCSTASANLRCLRQRCLETCSKQVQLVRLRNWTGTIRAVRPAGSRVHVQGQAKDTGLRRISLQFEVQQLE